MPSRIGLYVLAIDNSRPIRWAIGPEIYDGLPANGSSVSANDSFSRFGRLNWNVLGT